MFCRIILSFQIIAMETAADEKSETSDEVNLKKCSLQRIMYSD